MLISLGLLSKHFKKVDFKPWQLSVIKAVLGGKNSLVVQPTGNGKSLCCQFPCAVSGTLSFSQQSASSSTRKKDSDMRTASSIFRECMCRKIPMCYLK